MDGERFNELKVSRFDDPKPDRGFKTILCGSQVPPLLRAAADAREAIFCAKPVSLDLRTVSEVCAPVAASGVPCMLGFQRRYDPNFRAVRDRIASGAAGRLEHVVMRTRDPAPPPVSYVEHSGGPFRDQAIHDFDMARYLLGEEILTV